MVRSYLLFLIYTLFHIANAEFHNYLEHFQINKLTVHDPLLRHDDDRPTLTANTTKLTSNEEWVTFSIDNVQDPSEDDIIAIFTPPDAYKDGTAPVKYEYIAPNNIDYLSQGSASLSLRLVNMRSDIRAVFIRHGLTSPTIATLQNNDIIISNKAYDNPHGIHLLIGGTPSEIKVQWTTRSPGDNPLVKYGTRSGRLEYISPATTTTYTRDDMCGGVAAEEGWIDPGMFHTASMTGLKSNTKYYYQVGDSSLGRGEEEVGAGGGGGDGGSWSPEMSFISHPGVGPDVSVSFLAVADQGVGEPDGSIAAQEYEPAIRVAQRLAEEVERGSPWYNNNDTTNNNNNNNNNNKEPQPYTMILHNGDISYARGYSALWDTFLLQQQAVATRVPYATCPGNHEMDWPDMFMYQECVDSFGECGVPYSTRFPMPIAGGGSGSGEEGRPSPNKQWYSFDYGPIHFTVISTEHEFTEGSAQHHWMNADLKSVDRSVTPWLVMATHRPVYVDSADYKTYDGKQTTAIQLQTALEHVLHHHRVDVVLSGHHHSYQRMCPVKKGKCRYTKKHGRPDATVYIVHGNGGAKFYDDGIEPKPEWADAVFMTTYGHLRVHADRTKFHVQAVDVDDGEMFDEVVLEKKGHEGSGKVQKFSSSYDDDGDDDKEEGDGLAVEIMMGGRKGDERGRQRLGGVL